MLSGCIIFRLMNERISTFKSHPQTIRISDSIVEFLRLFGSASIALQVSMYPSSRMRIRSQRPHRQLFRIVSPIELQMLLLVLIFNCNISSRNRIFRAPRNSLQFNTSTLKTFKRLEHNQLNLWQTSRQIAKPVRVEQR